MLRYAKLESDLKKCPKTWLITGCAGFIGSNLLETLLSLDQYVVGMDNFSTGYRRNLDEVQAEVNHDQWTRFMFIEGDVRNPEDCRRALVYKDFYAAADSGDAGVSRKVDYVLHQAALGSVPRSLDDPVATNETNICGFLNMLVAARDAEVTSFTYAASSSTYGDHPSLPKKEDLIGRPLSPYAVTKYVNELYADVFALNYGFESIGLRYFNVFGKRQDPNGAYAAVIPRWTASMIKGEPVFINGDGETSRDFCFIENAVQANLLAATADGGAKNQVFNVAVGDRTSLNELYAWLNQALAANGRSYTQEPIYRDFRKGDVRHSQADISKAAALLGYEPMYRVEAGIDKAMPWYIDHAFD